VRTHHKFQEIQSFLRNKVRTSTFEEPSLFALDKPPSPLITDVFYGRPLNKIMMKKVERYLLIYLSSYLDQETAKRLF